MRPKPRKAQLIILGIALVAATSSAGLFLRAELSRYSYDPYINASIRIATEDTRYRPCLLLTFDCPATNTYSRTESCITHPKVEELDCGDTLCSRHTCLKKAAYFPDPERQYGTAAFCALYRQCDTQPAANCIPGEYDPVLCRSEMCAETRTDLPPCLWLTLEEPEASLGDNGSGDDDGTGEDNGESASSQSSSVQLIEGRNTSGTVLFRSSASSASLRCTTESVTSSDGTIRCVPETTQSVPLSPPPAPLPAPRPSDAEKAEALEAALRRKIEEKLVPAQQVDDRLEQLRSHVEEATERLTLVASAPTLSAEAKEKVLATITWLKEAPITAASPEELRIQKEAVQTQLRQANAVLQKAYHRIPQAPPPTPNRLLAAGDRVFAAMPRILALLKQENVVVPMTAASTFAEVQGLYAGIRRECVANANACDRIAEVVPRLEQVLKMLKDALRSAGREDLLQRMQEMMQE